MKTYTITLTSEEDLALSYISASQQEWIDNVVHERCRIAVDEIVAITVERCLALGMPIPESKKDMVVLAFSQQWIQSGATRNRATNSENSESQG
jgi:hypothetical protein